MFKAIFVLLLMTILYVNCDGGYMDPKQKSSSSRTGSPGSGSGVGGTGGSTRPPAGAPSNPTVGNEAELEADVGCTYSPPFDLQDELYQVMADITNCEGHPFETDWLVEAVTRLQAIDPRFGYMYKTNPDRIPRDVITFNWLGDGDGSNWFYVFDVVASGCNNWPSDANYEDPQPSARVAWQFCNPDGYAGNGIFRSTFY